MEDKPLSSKWLLVAIAVFSALGQIQASAGKSWAYGNSVSPINVATEGITNECRDVQDTAPRETWKGDQVSLSLGIARRAAVMNQENDRLEQAMALAKCAASINIEDERIWRLLAELQLKNNQLAEAQSSLKRARNLSPKNANIWFAMGSTAGKQGDLQHARYLFEKGLELDPNNQKAKRDLAIINQMASQAIAETAMLSTAESREVENANRTASRQVDPEIHKLCSDVRDYAGCIERNTTTSQPAIDDDWKECNKYEGLDFAICIDRAERRSSPKEQRSAKNPNRSWTTGAGRSETAWVNTSTIHRKNVQGKPNRYIAFNMEVKWWTSGASMPGIDLPYNATTTYDQFGSTTTISGGPTGGLVLTPGWIRRTMYTQIDCKENTFDQSGDSEGWMDLSLNYAYGRARIVKELAREFCPQLTNYQGPSLY